MEGTAQNIEAWLLGELDAEGRAAFENELKNSPNLRAETERQRQLLAALQSLALREKVVGAIGPENLGKTEEEIALVSEMKTGAFSGAPPQKNRAGNWWKALLFLVLGGTFWIGYQYFTSVQNGPAPVQNLPPEEKTAPPGVPTDLEKPSIDVKKIAQKETPAVNRPPSTVRRPLVFEILEKDFDEKYRAVVRLLKNGQLADASADLKNVEKSILPEDEIRAMDEGLEAQMDTLNFLQGLSALQSGRFDAAVLHFLVLDFPKKPFREAAQFYLLQAFLFNNDQKNARAMFKKIRADKNHRFRETARLFSPDRFMVPDK